MQSFAEIPNRERTLALRRHCPQGLPRKKSVTLRGQFPRPQLCSLFSKGKGGETSVTATDWPDPTKATIYVRLRRPVAKTANGTPRWTRHMDLSFDPETALGRLHQRCTGKNEGHRQRLGASRYPSPELPSAHNESHNSASRTAGRRRRLCVPLRGHLRTCGESEQPPPEAEEQGASAAFHQQERSTDTLPSSHGHNGNASQNQHTLRPLG